MKHLQSEKMGFAVNILNPAPDRRQRGASLVGIMLVLILILVSAGIVSGVLMRKGKKQNELGSPTLAPSFGADLAAVCDEYGRIKSAGAEEAGGVEMENHKSVCRNCALSAMLQLNVTEKALLERVDSACGKINDDNDWAACVHNVFTSGGQVICN